MGCVIIPKIIHQTWKDDNLPKEFKKYCNSWVNHHPDWEYRFYTDTDCIDFVRQTFPEWLDVYERYRVPVQRADLFRYLVIYHCGGLYADMDMECFKPVDNLLKKGSCLLSIEASLTYRFQKALDYPEPFQVANCIFAACPKHPFFKRVLDRVRELGALTVQDDSDVEETTGPRMITRLFFDCTKDMRNSITLLPQINLMSPKEYLNIFPINLNMYARHHCAGTWKKNKQKVSLKKRIIERNRLPSLW